MRELEEGAHKKAVRGFAKILAVIIILSVAALGDVMYIIEMNNVFKGNGILMTFCYLGAFTSFMAIGYLLIGKSSVFSPGGQMLAAWVVFAAELLIIALNIMLTFNHDRTGFMGMWAMLSPATPVAHMLGVALIYFLDPEIKPRQRIPNSGVQYPLQKKLPRRGCIILEGKEQDGLIILVFHQHQVAEKAESAWCLLVCVGERWAYREE